MRPPPSSPPEYAAWGSFHQLADRNLSTLKEMMEEAASSGKDDPLKKKIGDFWSCGNDVNSVDNLGMTPVQDLLNSIDTLNHRDTSFTDVVAAFHKEGISVFFGLYDAPDAKNSVMSIAQLRQGGLGLPDRDYYFDEDKAETRDKYVEHIKRMLKFVAPTSSDEELSAAATEVTPINMSKSIPYTTFR